tara:strand:+ start:6724 stop:7707 length:984 start_codon:yes stop_codon:yes gene_type:complete
MINDIRTGVIGVGSMGQNHARIYNEISNFVAVSDPNEKQGRMVANRFGVDWYENYSDMLDKVDAVTIAVPTIFHKDVAETIAGFGVHILVEKPLASNASDSKVIVDAANQSGVKLAVGHVERHNPVVAYAKKAIIENKWGELITLSSRRVSNFPARIHDVGVLFDLLIHDIDICTYLSGSKPKSVYAVGGKLRAKHEDHVNLVIEHENSVISICEANWLTPMKIRKLGITSLTNYVELDYQKQTVETFESNYLEVDEKNLYNSNLEFSSDSVSINKAEPLLMEIIDFLESIDKNTPPMVTGLDGFEVVKVSEAALKSLETGFPVNLD